MLSELTLLKALTQTIPFSDVPLAINYYFKQEVRIDDEIRLLATRSLRILRLLDE
jgi:DICT domain-containing protein